MGSRVSAISFRPEMDGLRAHLRFRTDGHHRSRWERRSIRSLRRDPDGPASDPEDQDGGDHKPVIARTMPFDWGLDFAKTPGSVSQTACIGLAEAAAYNAAGFDGRFLWRDTWEDAFMSEQVNELRRVNWSECFPFTRIFRTFRVAASPGRLGMALATVILACAWGGILDSLWSSPHQPLRNEVNAFSQVASIGQWRDENRKATVQLLREVCSGAGVTLPVKLEDEFAKQPAKVIEDALKDIRARHMTALAEATAQLADQASLTEEQKRERIAEKVKPLVTAYSQVRGMGPRGVFRSFAGYECRVGRQFMHAARMLNFTGGLSAALSPRGSGQADAGHLGAPVPAAAVLDVNLKPDLSGSGLASAFGGNPIRRLDQGYAVPAEYGVLPCLILALRGVQWMWVEHTLYFILFWLPVLVIGSLFGGALCRMAAMDLARDEQISAKAALCFAWRKLLGFLSAPLVPVICIIVIGLFHVVGGLFGSIPWFGELIGGLIAGLVLVGGFLMALLAVGAVAGGGLMWPTIAVEGSDGFDAMSRSYSYIFTRPWHAAFYAAVAAVYGAICYLFVRFLLFVALRAARLFLGMGLIGYRPGTGAAGAGKVDVIWPSPTFADLAPARLPLGAEGLGESAMAVLFHLWMLLAVALLAAFVVSFFLSGSTVIYFLLRRHVDATDIEDVFVEEGEEAGEPASCGSAGPGPAGSAAGPASAAAEPTGVSGSSTSTEPKPGANAQGLEPPASPQP